MSIEDELFSAVRDGDRSRVEFLLGKNSASIKARDEQGNTLLHEAVLHNCYNIISLLIRKGLRINIQNYRGWTPLHLAVSLNDFAMVNALLELCLKLDIADTGGNLPIHLAAEMGYIRIIELLYGDKNTINAKNKHGLTPLHLVVQKGCKEAVEMLICGGADLDIQDSKKGDTSLIMAVKENHVQIAKLLLGKGADYNKTNNAGEAFSAFAISEEMINIVSKYDEFSDLSIPSPSTFKASSRKRKAFSDISNTSSSSSSDRARICKRRRAIDEILNSSMSYTTDYSTHESEEFLDILSTSSFEPKTGACALKRRCAIDGSASTSLTCKRRGLDDLNSVYSESESIGSTNTLDISPPRSDISEPITSECQDALLALSLNYSAPSSPEKTR